ncbi:MAG: hypothetical protein ACLTTQ_00495 [Christensenellales bacterium]
MKKRFFPLPLLLAVLVLLSACGASVPDAEKTLTESLLSAISEEDFAAAAELLDSESGLAETTIRSYIYALEAETDCDFLNGARVVGYTAYEDYTDESSPEEQRTLHKLRADIKVGTMPFTLTVVTVEGDDGVSVYDFAFELKN